MDVPKIRIYVWNFSKANRLAPQKKISLRNPLLLSKCKCRTAPGHAPQHFAISFRPMPGRVRRFTIAIRQMAEFDSNS